MASVDKNLIQVTLFTYISTELCCQGGNLFLGGIQLPAQLTDLSKQENRTSKSTDTKADVPATEKHLMANTHASRRTQTAATNEGGSQI